MVGKSLIRLRAIKAEPEKKKKKPTFTCAKEAPRGTKGIKQNETKLNIGYFLANIPSVVLQGI